jgi:AmmeMemoRadiSam system protein A
VQGEGSAGARTSLVTLARSSIEHGLVHGRPLAVEPGAQEPALREPAASFVTLELRSALRGCIGTLEAHRPLAVDVAENAFAAAFRDPRFAPLARFELADLEVHVTLLSPLERLAAASETELLAQLRPGIDGLVLRVGERRATFLPAVWEDLPDPVAFLRALRRKAELPAEAWPAGAEAWRYTVREVA